MNLLVVVLCSWLFYRIWTLWLYPKLYSPLKRLPQLKVRSEQMHARTGECGFRLT